MPGLQCLDKENEFVWFDGISNMVGYLIPNPIYTYILDIYDLYIHPVDNIFKLA